MKWVLSFLLSALFVVPVFAGGHVRRVQRVRQVQKVQEVVRVQNVVVKAAPVLAVPTVAVVPAVAAVPATYATPVQTFQYPAVVQPAEAFLQVTGAASTYSSTVLSTQGYCR